MPGNIVPLYLCKTCKGLFVFESQAENHQVKCNGDAFKSPANLFVCEREHYLELITPSPSVPGPKASKKSQQNRQLCERKRRKTSPQINTTPETRVTGRSFLSKDDLSTLTQGSYRTTGPHVRDANRRTVPRSRSLPQANVITSPQNNPLNPNTCSTTGQSSSHQNILNSVVSLATPLSRSFVFTGNADRISCSFSPAKSDASFTSSADLQRVDHERLHSSDSETVMIQESSTPATNLLAYFNQLQQDRGTSVRQPTIQTGKEEEFSSIVQHSGPADNQSDLYLMLDNNSVEESNAIKSSTVQKSSVPVAQDSMSVNKSNNQNGHVSILTGDIQLEDFQFKTVSTATSASEIHGTNQLLDQTVYPHSIDDFLSFVPSVNEKNGKPAQIASSLEPLQTPVYQVGSESCSYAELATSISDRSMHLKSDTLGKDVIVYKNADTVQTFQTECSSSPAVHVFDALNKVETGVANVSSTQESSISGSVVLFLKPDGQIIQTMTVDGALSNSSEVKGQIIQSMAVDGALDSSTEVNSSMPVTTGISEQLCAGSAMQVQVCESVVQDGTRDGSLHQMSVTEPALNSDNTNTTGMDTGSSFVPSGKGVTTKAKTKTQIRQEELSALREEVLLQAREIPVEGEAKKIHYSCNVCGHVAKSVKFMHNHLQMHADGKVHFECDQCDFKSRLRSKLAEHQQRHTRSRLLCHLCPATFMDLASLNRHVTAKHSENEVLKCEQCDFRTSYASLLKEHMLKHTGDLLCCNVDGCNYKTAYLRALRVHQKRHTCEKNYHCQLCSYEAVEKSTLDRHMKSHTQERPFQCCHCDFRANTKYSVVVHMQHKHGQQQKSCYACDQCSFYTSSASSMAKHLKTHLSTFTCPLCNHHTCTLASIKKHLHQVHQVVNLEVVQDGETKMDDPKNYMCTAVPTSNTPTHTTTSTMVPETHKSLMDPSDKAMMEGEATPDRGLMEASYKVFLDSGKSMMETLMMGDAMNVDCQDLPPFPLTDMERPHVDPMKLSLVQDPMWLSVFQDPGPLLGLSGSGSSLTRASSIPDLSTFAGMNRSNSQSDMLSFPGISTVTRSNSMSDLLSFANAICADSGEAINMGVETINIGGEAIHMDISLSDAASATTMDVRGLSLEDSALSEDVGKMDSPGSVLVTLQCSKCLLLLTSEEDVEKHKKSCKGAILVV